VPGSIAFVGNFTHAPNVDAALWLGREIMPKLRTQTEGAALTIAGPVPPPAVRSLAAADIRIAGRVDDLPGLLAETAVVVAPLRTGGGMRVKVVEALAHGKAVVTTPRGAEGLAPDAPLEIGRDAGELAARLAALLADAGARADLGRRAAEFAAANHGPRAYAARLERTYEEAVRRSAVRSAAR
jgi:glycosyltransferase involved in cell wall biosynthesis